MSKSDYTRSVEALDRAVESALSRQVLDEASTEDGGYAHSSWGIAAPTSNQTCELVTRFGMAYLTPESSYHGDTNLLKRIERGMAFQRRCQRPSGCIDLPNCNFDSGPDTAFGVAKLSRLAWYARARDGVDGTTAIRDALEPYLISAAAGIADTGFHTPNHRWVIVGALSQVNELYPDKAFADEIEAYLSEGIDINDDGEYTERSHAIYSHVVNNHLIEAARSLDRPALLKPVRRNLHTLIDFLNHDWTIDTSVSRRQDYGERIVPTRGVPSFYYMARHDNNDRFAAAARGLLENGGWEDDNVASLLVSHFAHEPDWQDSNIPSGSRPDSLSRQMKDSQVWRIRDGKFSATVATRTNEVISLSYGSAAMGEICIISPYFGWGFFQGSEMAFEDGSATVTLERSFRHGRPGYWKPLNRAVPWGQLDIDERKVHPEPEFELELAVEALENGLKLRLRTEGGLSQVPFAIEARFPTEGRLEFERSSVPAMTDGPVFLGDETMTYHQGGDTITLGPGFHAHRLSDAPNHPDGTLRVLLTDWSPVDRTFVIRAGERSGQDIVGRTSRGGPANLESE